MIPDRDDELRERDRVVMRRFVIVVVLVNLLIVGVVWGTGYLGRQALVDRQRVGCERGKADRRDNAGGWWTQARSDQAIADDPFQSPKTRAARRASARKNRARARRIRSRIIPCSVAYPDASLFGK